MIDLPELKRLTKKWKDVNEPTSIGIDLGAKLMENADELIRLAEIGSQKKNKGILVDLPEQTRLQALVFEMIRAERIRQDVKWGADRKNHPLYWLAILVEEVGEFAKAIIERDISGMKKEGNQVSAVSVAIMEAMDYMQKVLLDEIEDGKGQGDASRP